MDQSHLTKVWQWISVACVLFLLTSILSLQGGQDYLGELIGGKAGDVADKKPAVGYFGAIVGGALLSLASAILLLHARRFGEEWHSRIPVVWLTGLNTKARDARIYQACVLFALLVLPMAGVIRCVVEAETGDICEQDTKFFYKGSETTLLWAPTSQTGRQMRLRREGLGDAACTSGVEVFPRSLTPLGVYGAPAVAGVASLAALLAIFRPRRRARAQKPDKAPARLQ